MMNKHILLIDDSTEDAELALRAIRKFDDSIKVTWAQVSKEVLNTISNYNDSLLDSDHIDLVLLDIKMFELSGFEVLDKIRSGIRSKQTPIVMLSSSKIETDITKAYKMGANGYIQKPCDFKEYNAVMSTLCHYWLIINKA
ncbi:MAG: response regulator [Salibacteraceae bacterium]|jgi:two-component system, response regulator|nr:response regulator [Salibacteraceae bacterium]MDP4686583.1 response regulator [Salibacteraceae bacterium]MDP4764211.1 response regulator [Salibacteraceae bacterium]MDP4843271.1 response regulator [Salibacteraceae bacterium]MDP4933895.1 response regulator [Salibacteraceae bacterium]